MPSAPPYHAALAAVQEHPAVLIHDMKSPVYIAKPHSGRPVVPGLKRLPYLLEPPFLHPKPCVRNRYPQPLSSSQERMWIFPPWLLGEIPYSDGILHQRLKRKRKAPAIPGYRDGSHR